MSPADPEMTAVVRLSRAEAYMALKQYRLALEDTEFCPRSSCSAEVGHSLTLQQFTTQLLKKKKSQFQVCIEKSLSAGFWLFLAYCMGGKSVSDMITPDLTPGFLLVPQGW